MFWKKRTGKPKRATKAKTAPEGKTLLSAEDIDGLRGELFAEARALLKQRAGLREDALELRLDRLQALRQGIAIAEFERQRRQPIWLRLNTIIIGAALLLSAIVLLLLNLDASSVDVDARFRVDGMHVVLGADTDAGEPASIALDVECDTLEVDGVEQCFVGAKAVEIAGPATVSAPAAAHATEGQADSDPSSVAVATIQSVNVPREYGISFAVDGANLVLTISHGLFRQMNGQTSHAPDADAKPLRGDPVRVLVSAPDKWRGEWQHTGETAYDISQAPAGGAISVSAVGGQKQRLVEMVGRPRPDRPIRIAVGLTHEQQRRAILIGLQAENTRHIGFMTDTRHSAEGVSHIIAGQIEFRGIEVAPVVLGFREPVRLVNENPRHSNGLIRHILLTPGGAAAEDGADGAQFLDAVGPHLIVEWSGQIAGLSVGAEQIGREAMPSALMTMVGTKTRLYLSGLIVYAWIFVYSLLRRSAPGATDFIQPDELMV